jgi:hypothetical protein
MKKIITSFLIGLSLSSSIAQTIVADFENLSLPINSFYFNVSGNDWQTANAEFRYDYDQLFTYWSEGYSYTNKKDSSVAGTANLYGCRPLKGFNNSDYYVTAQPNAFIKVKSPSNGVSGFYVTNSTYAYKSMKNGDQFAKKFGGISGNDPDFFLLTVKGFLGGVLKSDSVNFYLADYRNSNNNLDYIVDNWQWLNTSSLNRVDSITFILRSSDNNGAGMNTPAFFCLDNFTTISNAIGLTELTKTSNQFRIYPNPAKDMFTIKCVGNATLFIKDVSGRVVLETTVNEGEQFISIANLMQGVYLVDLISDKGHSSARLIKQ